LALDEHRVKFIPSFCTGGKPKHKEADSKASEHNEVMSEIGQLRIDRRQESGTSYKHELHVNVMIGQPTDVEEVFFAGAHAGTFRFLEAQ
jgi:hypothetical protein